MKLKRELVVAAVVALVLTVVLIEAVGAKAGSSVVDEESIIANLHMSDSCEGLAMLLFPNGTETVYVVFDYSNMQGQERRIKVAAGEVTLYDATHSYTGSGSECIEVTHTSGPIPPDTYQTQIYEGSYPMKTLLWHVRPGGPGEITSLHMSISSDGAPREKFIESTQIIWAVFDYANMTGDEVGIDVYEGDYHFYASPRTSLAGSGTKAISVTHYLVAGFPAGQYRTHVVRDEFVDGVKSWSVLYGVYLPLVLKNHP